MKWEFNRFMFGYAIAFLIMAILFSLSQEMINFDWWVLSLGFFQGLVFWVINLMIENKK